MVNRCICYIGNQRYLFSTLLSALQARMNTSTEVADVAIFNIGEKSAESEAVEKVARQHDVLFFYVGTDMIDNMHIMFARLFLDRFAPAQYERFIYLDGDTQIARSIDEFVQIPLRKGGFLAIRDPITIINEVSGRTAAEHRARWSSIGLQPADYSNYVNSGVLVMERDGWDQIGRRAALLYASDPVRYKFPDQDVINIVGREELEIASFKWNFPGFLTGLGYEEIVDPGIYHFMSNPRPWHGPFLPWGRTWHTPYMDLVKQYPELAIYRPQFSRARYFRYIAQQRYKQIFDGRLWGSKKCLEAMRRLEASVIDGSPSDR